MPDIGLSPVQCVTCVFHAPYEKELVVDLFPKESNNRVHMLSAMCIKLNLHSAGIRPLLNCSARPPRAL